MLVGWCTGESSRQRHRRRRSEVLGARAEEIRRTLVRGRHRGSDVGRTGRHPDARDMQVPLRSPTADPSRPDSAHDFRLIHPLISSSIPRSATTQHIKAKFHYAS